MESERIVTMASKISSCSLGVSLVVMLLAGCSSEVSKSAQPPTPAGPSTNLGRAPAAGSSSKSAQAGSGSSLDAHRQGSALVSGPLKEIRFDFDSYNLTAEARTILQVNAAWLKANPAANVEIEGHCDERGATDYNLALGAKRARSAMDYLISLGIAPIRIKATSYGEELPMCREATESCYGSNRRDRFVEIRARPSS
jgi:peptidoglycan-associated lipoprotein